MRFADIRKHPDGVAVAWQLLNERPPEANISHKTLPSFEEHAAYVMKHPYRVWLVIEGDVIREPLPHREVVGAISLTKQNEIGIAILYAHQRQGYARRAIQEVISIYPPLPAEPGMRNGYYIANVAPENRASRFLFEVLGAKLLQVTYRFGG